MRILRVIIGTFLFVLIIKISAVCGFAQVPDTQDWTTVFRCDFNDGETPSEMASRLIKTAQSENVHSVEFTDEEHQKSAKLSLNKNGALLDLNLMKNSDKSSEDIEIKGNSGRYEISYDVMYTKRDAYAPYIRVCGDYRESANDTWWLNNNNYSMVLNVIGAANSKHNFSYGKSHRDVWYGNYVSNNTDNDIKDEWVSVKIIIDTINNKADYYYKANGEFKKILWNNNDFNFVGEQSEMLTGDGNSFNSGIRHLEFQAISDSVETDVYFDNITIKREPVTVDKIEYFDSDGNQTEVSGVVTADLRKIDITLSGTVYAELCHKNIVLKQGNSDIDVYAVYDEQNKKYTLSIPQRLNNGSYTLNVFGKSYTFKCSANFVRFDNNLYRKDGDVVKKLDELSSGDKISVKAEFNSSGTGKTKFIVAAYDGETLKEINTKNVTYVSYNASEVSITVPTAKNLKIKAFAWKTDESIKPLGSFFETKADFSFDFENMSSDDVLSSFETNGSFSIVRYDTGQGKSLCQTSGSINKQFLLSIKSGITKFSFKYLPNKSFEKLMLYLCGGNTDYAAMNDINAFGFYRNGDASSPADVYMQRDNNKWYKIDVYLDMDSKIAFYYIDDKYFGSTELDITTFEGVRLEAKGEGCIYYDDFSLETTYNELPKEVKGDIDIQISSDSLARTYFDKNEAEFNVKLTNKTAEQKTIILKSLVLENETPISDSYKEVTLEPKSQKQIKVNVTPQKYGYLSLLVSAVQNENEIGVSPIYDFAVVNVPEQGKRDKSFGIQLHGTWSNQRFGDIAKNFEMIEKLGIGFVRSECLWGEFEYTPGIYRFSAPYQTLYDVTKEKGVKISVILGYENKNIASKKVPETDEEINAFANYAAEVVKAHEYQIDDVEVWNEWTNYGTFNPDKLGFDVYGKIFKATAEAVKKEPKGKNTSIWADEPSASTDRNVVEYNDGYATHPYRNKGTPEDWMNSVTDSMNLLNEQNGKTARVYASEFGWPSVGKSGYATTEQQAAFFVRASVLNKAYKWFEKMSWYTANDGGYTDDIEDHFGMLKPSNNDIPYFPKPVYLAAGNYMSLMMNSEYSKMIKLGEYSYAFYFTLENGKEAVVVWAAESENDLKEGHSEKVSVPFDPKSIQVVDMYGNVQKTMWASGEYNIEASGEPLYLIQK